jgi:phage-related protein
LATITSLGFTIFSTYSGRGVSSARRDINQLNRDLSSNTTNLNNASRAFFSLSTAAMAVGPALAPIGAAVLGGAAAFVTMSAAGLGAAGVLGGAVYAAFKGTSASSKAMQNDLKGVTAAFKSWGNQVAPMLQGPVHTALTAVSGAFSKFTPLVQKMIPLANDVANAFAHWTNTNLQGWVSWLGTNGVPILANFITIGKNLARVFGDMLRAFAPMAQTMSAQLAVLSAKLKGWADGGGFVRFIDRIKAEGPTVSAFFKALGQALANVSRAMIGLGPVSLSLATTLLKIVAAMPPWMIQAIVVAILAWRTAMLVYSAATVIATAAQIAFAVASSSIGVIAIASAASILLIVAAVAAVGVGIAMLVIHWNTVWNAIKNTAITVWNFLTQGLGQLVLALMGPVGVLIFLAAHWQQVWTGMKVVADAIWTGMKVAWQAVCQAFIVVWQTVSTALVAAWNAIWNAIKVAGMAIWNAMKTAWAAAVQGFATVWNTVSAGLRAAWNAVWNGMKTAAQAIWSAMQAAWNAVMNAMRAAMNTFNAAMRTTWNALWNAIKATGDAIWNALKAAWNAACSAMRAVMNTFNAAMRTTWNALWNALKATAEAIWNALKAAWSAFTSAVRSVMNTFNSAMRATWNALWNFFKSSAEAVWNALKAAWNAATSAMRSVMNTFNSAMRATWSGLWNAIKSTAQSVWNAIQSGFKSFSNGVQSTLKALVSAAKSIWSGIVSAFKGPIDTIVGIWNKVAGALGLNAIKLSIGGLASGGSGSSVPSPSVGPGGGGPTAFAVGGHLDSAHWPGTSTNDRIPALLSAGEFVVRASSVRKYGTHFLDAINRGRYGERQGTTSNRHHFAEGGQVGGYAIGGIIPDPIGTIKKIGGAIAGAAKGVAGLISGLLSDPAGWISKNISTLIGAAGQLLPGFDSIVKSILPFNVGDIMKPLLNSLVDKVPDPMPPGTPKPAGSLIHAGIKTLVDAAISFFQDKQKTAVQAMAVAGSQSVQAWAPVILQALAMEGLPSSWLGPIESMMQQESGGNPNAVNNWDSNAAAGTPSMGLMQVIGPTFAAYHWPGTSNNILDPLANIAAALNYIKHVYGYPPGSPYALGTTNAKRGWHRMGEHGPEMWFEGGERVWDAHKTRKWMRDHGGDGSSQPVVQVTNNWYGNPTQEAVQYAEGGMAEKLRQACAAGVGKRPN